jgi:hypothetical protein
LFIDEILCPSEEKEESYLVTYQLPSRSMSSSGKKVEFSSDLARRMTNDHDTSPSIWWAMFWSKTPTLQSVEKWLL